MNAKLFPIWSARHLFVNSRIAWAFIWVAFALLAFTPQATAKQPDHIILIVLEGIGKEGIQSGSMPNVAQLAQNGATTWSAESLSPPLTVSSMATLLTGLPVSKHRVTAAWEEYDFARSFLRSPTVFDYMDLAGGRDSAVFLMDERFYQLSRPEIYVDSQTCGIAKPQCNPATISIYVRDYLRKVTSEKGYGFRLIAVPNLLLVHMPTASRSGKNDGWDSKAYQTSISEIDTAIGKIRDNYKELKVLDSTMFLVTSLNASPAKTTTPGSLSSTVPWIVSGANVKQGYNIKQPVSLIDTGATILYALGLSTHTEWDSHAINGIFSSVPEHRTTNNELPASLY